MNMEWVGCVSSNYGRRSRFARRPIDKDTAPYGSLHHPDAPSYDAEQTEGRCSARWAIFAAAADSAVLLAMRKETGEQLVLQR